MDDTGLTVVLQGVRVVGVPVATKDFKRDFLQELVDEEPAELETVLIPMQDAQASFRIFCILTPSRLSHLLCTIPPSIT